MTDEETRYGYPLDQWEQTKADMTRVLSIRAREARTITYSELSREVLPLRLPPDSYALAAMLGEISEESDADGRGMLSVLVVHKDGDGRPGGGFFELAAKLGRAAGSDHDLLWIEEMNRVTAAAGGLGHNRQGG